MLGLLGQSGFHDRFGLAVRHRRWGQAIVTCEGQRGDAERVRRPAVSPRFRVCLSRLHSFSNLGEFWTEIQSVGLVNA
jgi:hypothetical protein